MLTRRSLLGMLGAAGAASCLPARLSFAASSAGLSNRLVYIALRGGPDGLELLPPVGDPSYAAVRGGLDRQGAGAHSLDGFFALNPKLINMAELYQQKALIALPAAHFGHDNRSHFDAQKLTENGYNNPLQLDSGWLNRALVLLERRAGQPLLNAGWAPYDELPVLMRGEYPVSTVYKTGGVGKNSYYDTVASLYAPDDVYAQSLSNGLQERQSLDEVKKLHPDLSPEDVAKMAQNAGSFVGQAALAGRVLRSEEGPRIAFLTTGGFDSHNNQSLDGGYGNTLNGLDDGIKALAANLGDAWKDTVVVLGGEFGRTVKENGTKGTDHGIGGTWFVLGGAVQGGQVLGDWPGLRDDQLQDRRYLRGANHMVGVFKALLRDGYGLDNNDLEKVFPDYAAVPASKGLLRSAV